MSDARAQILNGIRRSLRRGELAACFGEAFAGLPVQRPYTIPGGRMKLLDRVTEFDPRGGRFGLGRIRAEADIHPDDWFLTCHFVDDRVMPGTLMFECCMHTFRVMLLRLGWVGESGAAGCEPVPGVASQLKCRGQVIETTRRVLYEISLKEIGYGPEPYVIADALMYADGKPIVEIGNMSLRYAGSSREAMRSLWDGNAIAAPRAPLYTYEQILAFAIGKPSEAFGEPYRIFDEGRVIARLPGPPFQFLDRVTDIDAERGKYDIRSWTMEPGEVPVRIDADAFVLEAEDLLDRFVQVPLEDLVGHKGSHGALVHSPRQVLLLDRLAPCGPLPNVYLTLSRT